MARIAGRCAITRVNPSFAAKKLDDLANETVTSALRTIEVHVMSRVGNQHRPDFFGMDEVLYPRALP